MTCGCCGGEDILNSYKNLKDREKLRKALKVL